MLRPSRQSSILPNYGSSSGTTSSSSTYYSGYGNSGYGSNGYGKSAYGSGCDSYSSGPSFASPRSSKRRPSYSSNIDFLPSAIRNSTSWLAVGLAFFILLSGYYQSTFHWALRELEANTFEQAIRNYRDLYNENRLNRKRMSSDMDERYSILERLNAKLHKEKEDLRSSYEKKIMKEFTKRRQEEDRLIAREEAFKGQIKKLQDSAAREARRSVSDR